MIQEGADEDLQQQLEALLSKEIAGIDEVGKGALFGPVFAGAVILDKQNRRDLKTFSGKNHDYISDNK